MSSKTEKRRRREAKLYPKTYAEKVMKRAKKVYEIDGVIRIEFDDNSILAIGTQP